MIEFHSEDVDIPQFDIPEVRKIIKEIIQENNYILDTINVIFCSDEYLLTLNNDFLSHDYYTDIITFHYSEEEILSDIFISLDRVADNAEHFSIPFLTELYRIIFHGVLHLVGFDDKSEADKEEMTSKENYYLEKIIG